MACETKILQHPPTKHLNMRNQEKKDPKDGKY